MLDEIEVIGSKGITLCRAKWINCNFSLKCHYRDCKILSTWIKIIWLEVCSENVAWPEAHNIEKKKKKLLVAGGPDTRKERVILDQQLKERAIVYAGITPRQIPTHCS